MIYKSIKAGNIKCLVLLFCWVFIVSCEKEIDNSFNPPPSQFGHGDVVRKIGNGDIKVIKGDLHGAWNEELEFWDFSLEGHGERTTQTYQQYANEGIYSLFEIELSLNEVLTIDIDKLVNPSNITTIISSSFSTVELKEIPDKYYTIINQFNYNALILSSLENAGVDEKGLPDGSIVRILHPHGPINTAIAIAASTNTNTIIDKTVFVGVIDRLGIGRIDLEDFDLFKEHTIFVKMSKGRGDISISTSHATPKLAAYASNILSKDKTLTAADLKKKLFEASTKKELTIFDQKYNTETGEYEEDTITGEFYTLEFIAY